MSHVGAATPIIWRKAVRTVARHHRIRIADVEQPSGWTHRRARRIAAYLAIVGANASTISVARCAGLARSGLQRAVQEIEERREQPEFDAYLSTLEQELTA